MSIIAKIKAHEQEVFLKKIPPDLKTCPNCKQTPPYFKPHHCKKRLFLVVVEDSVQKIWSFLGRFKCPLCGSSFTYYPDFAIPYKRYVKDTIVNLSYQYIKNDSLTYRDVVKDNGLAIGYDRDTDEIDERQLEGSTVWRWLSYTAELNQRISKALDIIKQKFPSYEIFRQIHPIHPQKYRSDERKKVLSQSIRLFIVELAFIHLFGSSIFPKFATGYL